MSVQLKLMDLAAGETALPFADYHYPVERSAWNGLILVGEAPGAEEARLGQPFVGRSGQLLNGLLAKTGIERTHCLVANVFRRQPPKNKIDHFFISRRKAAEEKIEIAEEWGKFGAGYCRSEYTHDLDWLKSTLLQWQPRMVVALGRTPFWALTGESGLLTKVGQILPCRMAPEVPVIPTFHPSFILRGNWGLQPDWERHFIAAKQYLD